MCASVGVCMMCVCGDGGGCGGVCEVHRCRISRGWGLDGCAIRSGVGLCRFFHLGHSSAAGSV